jgi:hypothetical protein
MRRLAPVAHLAWLAPLALAAAPADPAPPPAHSTVRGRVVWDGPVPEVAPFEVVLLSPATGYARKSVPNPNRPRVRPDGRGVEGAVVFVRGIDPSRTGPPGFPPVVVEAADHQLRVLQGDFRGNVGVVGRGSAVEFVSRQDVFHAVAARGAAFFSLALPDPDRPRVRRLERPGVVELTSAAGHYWARAYLLVVDHPCVARTDADGRFEVAAVPAGPCELVAWLPNWEVVGHDRDPESGLVVRQSFAPPIEVATPITAAAGAAVERTVVLPANRGPPR